MKTKRISPFKGKTKENCPALAKMSKTKKAKFASGELIIWCKGETADTSEGVRKRTKTQTEQYASGKRQGYWKDKTNSEEQKKTKSVAQLESYALGNRKTTKGYVPWNKGLTAETDDRVAQLVDTMKKDYQSGKRINYRKGKTKETDESIARQSRTMKNKILIGEFTPKTENWGYKTEFYEDLGHYCRSKWEAKVCRILKRLNVIYLYEDKRFRLTIKRETTIYIPDLYIPEFNLIIEIKGYEGKDQENLRKFKRFCIEDSNYNKLLIGKKEYFKLIKKEIKTFNEFIKVCNETNT